MRGYPALVSGFDELLAGLEELPSGIESTDDVQDRAEPHSPPLHPAPVQLGPKPA